MAIFGNLADLPLPEVLTMIGNKSGCLLLWNLPSGKEYEIHVAESCIRGLLRNGQDIEDMLQIRDLMLELINCNIGDFEFQKRSPYDLKDNFHISIEHILLNTATAVDEINAYKEYFPHEKTRFKLAGPLDVWLDGELYSFWERSANLLAEGCSADEISKNLGLNLEKVQLHLYKLRSVGKIEPMRAMEKRASRNNIARPTFLETENFSNFSTPKQNVFIETFKTQEEDFSTPLNPIFDTPSVNNGKTKSVGLIRRMLNALTFGRLK